MSTFQLDNLETAVENPILTSKNNILVIHSIQDIDELIEDCIAKGLDQWGTEMTDLVKKAITDSKFPLADVIKSTDHTDTVNRLTNIALKIGISIN